MNKNYLSTVSCSALAIFFMACAGEKKEEVRKPNILFCIADDAGYPHFGAYGTKWVNTPAFDRVAKEGLLFERAYTCNAKSAPSRASIITGRNSWQLEEAANHWAMFPAKFKSYPEALSENGYYVGTTGKGWGPGYAKDSIGQNRQLTGKVWNEIKLEPHTSGISNIDYAANFKAFLANKPKDQPFCFWYGALEPHRGYEYASSLRAGKKTEDIDSVPAFWPDNEKVRTDMLDYALEVEHFDNHLEMILAALEEAGELDNTIIVVTSDHGMPFPRGKAQEYDYSNHIPLAVMWKNGLKSPGRVIHDYVSLIDIAPTFLEIAGLSAEETGMHPVTGHSMLDLVRNAPEVDRSFALIGRERHDVGRPDDQSYPIRGLLRGDYLYLRNLKPERWPAGNPETGYMDVDASPTKTEVLQTRRNPATAYFWQWSFGKRGAEELYNIAEDRDCIHNLVENPAYSELRKKMESELMDRLREQKDPRIIGGGEVFDQYPHASKQRLVWNRMKAGEKVPAPWIDESDYEPGATGLEVTWEK